jgi:hypothetical protein
MLEEELCQVGDMLRRKAGGGAAAEVQRLQWLVIPGAAALAELVLTENRGDELVGRHSVSHRDREVAVAATAGAEWDVDV